MKTTQVLAEIMKLVNQEYGFDIRTRRRKREIVLARWVYFKLARDFTKASLYQIGQVVDKDHATVLHGVKGFEAWQFQPSMYADHLQVYEKIGKMYQDSKDKRETLIERIERERKELQVFKEEIEEKYEQLKEKHNRMLKFFTKYERNALEKYGV